MWWTVLDRMLKRMIVRGRLCVVGPDDQTGTYGQGSPEIMVNITSDESVRRLVTQPALALGECYMDGTLRIDGDDLTGFMTLLLENESYNRMPGWYMGALKARTALRGVIQRNNPLKSKRNVAHHYDISDDLYALFLDRDMQYSCAYWPRPDMTLDEAQEAKKAHIASKLLIEPGMRVLDIGCGWGGLGLTLARDHGARVTGVTLSENQLATAQARARAEGLEDVTDFRLLDYRKLDEEFDRVVSVGMLEHVGAPHFDEYFAKVSDLMGADGIALIHSIVKSGPPRANNPWIDRYIFPGSYAPSASEIYGAIEKAWLFQSDDEALRLHYAKTLHAWRMRFEAQSDRIEKMFDTRFVRMFRFYLTSMEVSFRIGTLHVQQWQLAKRMDAVPITRDYLYASEAEDHRMAAE
ncbi:cyclopropane-fatty-acyl-phospholipid synthase family protein [Sagittula sp. P11]|uniref:class I SAM-dependent methyltransferase n=1 Tax=Sagittula sp. P11 TaxID=2009329 RepID=UPI0018E2297D|nr:cyclopropane-fatty-acyl-phospholipid synthase family protein [Sagittula sp. P11]